MALTQHLFCPIRGELNIGPRATDGLAFTEEKRRIDCINFLLRNEIPKENIRVEKTLIVLGEIGNQGRTALRADIVVYDGPVDRYRGLNRKEQRQHTLIVAEIKRDNKDASSGLEHQLYAALQLLPDIRTVGIYWDDVEQRLFYKKLEDTIIRIIEAPLAFIPHLGRAVERQVLRYSDLLPATNLVALFKHIEDTLHRYRTDKAARFQIMMQLLLTKMYDEASHKKTDTGLIIQDFSSFSEREITDEEIGKSFTNLLDQAITIYQGYLPDKIPRTFDLPGVALREVSKLLAPINLLNANPDVMQNFYMYFAKQLYKWDLAQYFTPYEVVDFIVRIMNPLYGEIIKDPACGSADFLISAFRRLRLVDDQAGDRVWGADNSRQAVQISVLNMLLNGDGKSNISEGDSLEIGNEDSNRFNLVLCNPPFGVKITENRRRILDLFDLGRGKPQQEMGILFTELCVKQAKADGGGQNSGRVAIILPNGYLGNRSDKYKEFRVWILKNTYVVGIIAFPRFTFKKSGADVSASVVILEKRLTPLNDITQTENYPIYVNYLESVGWEIGNKQAKKIYKRDPQTGTPILTAITNEPVLDADFDEIEADLLNSPAANRFRWLASGKGHTTDGSGWSVPIQRILNDPDHILDPKRLNRKYLSLINTLDEHEHVQLGDICEICPEGFRKQPSQSYRYVELADVHEYSYEYSEIHGWELPGRAKHLADSGDIFIARIWSSVNKWCIIGNEATKEPRIVVTNGCYRLKMRTEKRDYLVDLVVALSSEFYRVQMRALATGSDGLADISERDVEQIRIPIIQDRDKRQRLQELIEAMINSSRGLNGVINDLLEEDFSGLDVTPRRSIFAQL